MDVSCRFSNSGFKQTELCSTISTLVGTKESLAVAICDAYVTGVGVPNLSRDLSGLLLKNPINLPERDVGVKFIQIVGEPMLCKISG